MAVHIMFAIRMTRVFIPDVRYVIRVKLPFQNACPKIAIPSITGSDVGS
tara:strand:+ start:1064 stop:1210 length:147 start_codon:yes stop_codon:yes gene_type:complete